MKSKFLLGVALATLAAPAVGQEFPVRPIQVIVPYSAGGSTDLSLRVFADAFERLHEGATMVIRNQPGGGGAIGTSAAVHSRADGYTLGSGAQGPISILPHLGGTDYELDEFEFIGLFGRSLQLLVACADAPFEDFESFMEYASSAVPQIGNSGAGGANHISAQAFADTAGIEIENIPYDGAADARTACVGGHVEAIVVSPGEALDQVQAGMITPIFVMEDERIDLFPDTPTAVENGVDFTWSSWKGLFGPKGMGEAELEFLRTAVETVANDPEFVTQMTEMGELVVYEDAETLATRAQRDSEMAEAVLRDLGMYGMNQ
jgi:tripartite-type tricarboxylate transporter receptor subunit TctC